jgi:hypothetical protein
MYELFAEGKQSKNCTAYFHLKNTAPTGTPATCNALYFITFCTYIYERYLFAIFNESTTDAKQHNTLIPIKERVPAKMRTACQFQCHFCLLVPQCLCACACVPCTPCCMADILCKTIMLAFSKRAIASCFNL